MSLVYHHLLLLFFLFFAFTLFISFVSRTLFHVLSPLRLFYFLAYFGLRSFSSYSPNSSECEVASLCFLYCLHQSVCLCAAFLPLHTPLSELPWQLASTF